MQQKCVGSKQRRPWMFPFSNEENQKNTNNVEKQEVSRRWMESERSKGFEEGNVTKAHKTS